MILENNVELLQKKVCIACPLGHRAIKDLYDFVKMAEGKIINDENIEFLATVQFIIVSGQSDKSLELLKRMIKKYKGNTNKEHLLAELYTKLFVEKKVYRGGEKLQELEKNIC